MANRRPKDPLVEQKLLLEARQAQMMELFLQSEETPERLWSDARLLAVRAGGPYAKAIEIITPVLEPRVDTMQVDKHYRVYYHPNYVLSLIEQARQVSAKNPCPTCGAVVHSDLAYLAGVIWHQAQHPLRQHGDRGAIIPNLDVDRWAMATDMEINDEAIELFGQLHADQVKNGLVTPKMCLPHPMIYPKDYGLEDHKVCEEYYYLLKEEEVEEMQGPQPKDESSGGGEGESSSGQGKPDGDDSNGGDELDDEGSDSKPEDDSDEEDGNDSEDGSGDEQEDGEGNSDADSEEEETEGNQSFQNPSPGAPGKTPGTGKPVGGGCGSGATGQPQPWDRGEPGPGNDTPGVSEGLAELIAQQVAKDIKEAASRGIGALQHMLDWANSKIPTSKYNWKKELSNIARFLTSRLFGYKKRNTKKFHRKSASVNYDVIYLSSYNATPNILVVLDTSGSMMGNRILFALGEIQKILKSLRGNVMFVTADWEAGELQEVKNMQDLNLTGGGGTSMKRGVSQALVMAINKKKTRPDLVILISDCDSDFPSQQDMQGCPLLIVCVRETKDAHYGDPIPDWAKFIWVPTGAEH